MKPTESAQQPPRYANEVNLSAEEWDKVFTDWLNSHAGFPLLPPQAILTRITREEEEDAD